MVITFTIEQQSKLLAWAGAITEGHVNADCEPPGYALRIDVASPWNPEARAVCGANTIELGEVSLQLN
jgi:hypothetical protein